MWLPVHAERVAPGVYRIVAPRPREVAAADVAASLARIDALFARYPHDEDATRVIREQRDAG